MKLRNPSRSPGSFLAHIPVTEKSGIGDKALEKAIRQPLSNPNQLLEQLGSDFPRTHAAALGTKRMESSSRTISSTSPAFKPNFFEYVLPSKMIPLW